MFGMFKRPAKKVIEKAGNAQDGWFHMFWERQRLPDPGAMNYSYESLGLAPFSPIGPTVFTRQPILPILPMPQPYYQKAVLLNGMPTVTGQMMSTPLFDPESGYTFPTQANNGFPFVKKGLMPAGEAI